eukprot:Gb_23097 [translate_table: standard]
MAKALCWVDTDTERRNLGERMGLDTPIVLALRCGSLPFGCEAVSNQNAQQVLALPEKEVIQSHLPVRLPYYDFTPVTSPTFDIPLLVVKVMTSGMASSHSVVGSVYKSQEWIHYRSRPFVSAIVALVFPRAALSIPLSFILANVLPGRDTQRVSYSTTQCQCQPSKVLSPLVFFMISTHFTAPPKIPFAPTVLHLDALCPIILDNAYILCLTVAAGIELVDAYSSDTVITSSLRKEVHDPWAFHLHAALLCQAFAHCKKFPTTASHRSLGHVSVPVWLIILSDQLLIVALLLFPSQGQVLTRYSPVRHWKHHFSSDLHVLSIPPAFILSQDQTLHEIPSCITYSSLLRGQS